MKTDPIQTTITDLYREFGVNGVNPKWAMITEDCRDGDVDRTTQSLTGHAALYLGDFSLPSVLAFHDPRNETQAKADATESSRLHDAICVHPDEYPEDTEFDIAMPLLLSDTGDIIWGSECYWGEIDKVTVELAEKFGLKNIAIDLLEEVTRGFRASVAYKSLRSLIEKELGDKGDVHL